jgi:hypothetical protein
MKRIAVTAVAVAALALALPGAAGAFWTGNLHAEASLTEIRYEVDVCGAKGKLVRFKAGYEELNEGRIWYSEFSPSRQHKNCATWELSEETPMWAGEWQAAMEVTVRGHHKYTGPVSFTVTE